MCPLEPYHLGESPSDETVIWKYFPRRWFDSLVNDEALFFRRVFDFLADDPNEGAIPKSDQERDRKSALYRFWRDPKATIDQLRTEVGIAESIDGWGMRHTTVINCWTMRSTESKMMWQAYAGVDRDTHGVAVKSTVGMLRKALSNQERLVHTSCVEYIDYENERFKYGTGNVMTPMFHKSKHGYSDEFELRLHHNYTGPGPYKAEELWDVYGTGRGTKIKVDLSQLMCEVVMFPNATDIDLENVRAMCASKGVFAGTTLFRHSHLHPMRFDYTRS